MSRRGVIVLVGAAGAAFGVLIGAGWLGGYRINLTPSYPLGLWRIEPLGREVAAGDLIFICPPDTAVFRAARERGYLGPGLCPGWLSPLIKTVVAVSGQRVGVGRIVTIDGAPLAHSLVRQADAERRMLVPWEGGVVAPGHLHLHSDFAGSYDSRYFGPVPAGGLLGRARPVLTLAR